MVVLDEGFPDFSFLKDEYFDNLAKRSKQLIQVVMSDNIAIAVIDADEKYGALFHWFINHFAL